MYNVGVVPIQRSNFYKLRGIDVFTDDREDGWLIANVIWL